MSSLPAPYASLTMSEALRVGQQLIAPSGSPYDDLRITGYGAAQKLLDQTPGDQFLQYAGMSKQSPFGSSYALNVATIVFSPAEFSSLTGV